MLKRNFFFMPIQSIFLLFVFLFFCFSFFCLPPSPLSLFLTLLYILLSLFPLPSLFFLCSSRASLYYARLLRVRKLVKNGEWRT